MKIQKPVLLLFIAFILLRLIFIIAFPPFTDESLYIRWGQLMVDNPTYHWESIQRFSRQPLAFWLFGLGAILLKNPIIGARLVMLLANIPTFFIILHLTKRMFGERTSLIAAAILALSPLFILTQTLAIMDGFLFTISAVMLFLITSDWKRPVPYQLIGIGICIGVSLWIKTTGLFLLALAITGIIVKAKRQSFIQIIIMSLIPLLIVLPLILRPDFMQLFSEPGSFMLTRTEILHFPISIWTSNTISTIFGLLIYIPLLFTLPMMRKRSNTTLLLWFLIPTIAIILLGNNFRIRYFVLGTIALIPLLAAGISHLFELRNSTRFQIIFWVIYTAYSIYFISATPSFFSLFPKGSGERDYALSWPSGYGIPDMINWIDSHASNASQPMIIAVFDSPGNPSDYLLAQYYFSHKVRILFADFEKLKPVALQIPVYLATRSTLITPDIKSYLDPIKLFHKPATDETVGIYRVTFHQ